MKIYQIRVGVTQGGVVRPILYVLFKIHILTSINTPTVRLDEETAFLSSNMSHWKKHENNFTLIDPRLIIHSDSLERDMEFTENCHFPARFVSQFECFWQLKISNVVEKGTHLSTATPTFAIITCTKFIWNCKKKDK